MVRTIFFVMFLNETSDFLKGFVTIIHHTFFFSFLLTSGRPYAYIIAASTVTHEQEVCPREKNIDVLFHLLSPHTDLSKPEQDFRKTSSCCQDCHDGGTNDQNDPGLGFRSTREKAQSLSNKGKCQSPDAIDIKKWLTTLYQPYLLYFPIDSNPENEIRVVNRAIFSKVFPMPFKSETRLAAVSESALVNCLDFDLNSISSPLFHNLISGNYNTQLAKLMPVPLTHRYGGHQFGFWANQLGDGRAHLIGIKVNRNQERWELQLKGTGQTPYSRQGDGRAVLRSSVREFLASEAMYYLGVPTSRAATLVISDDVFARDQFYDGNVIYERGAIVMRLAPSWFRFGSLEILTKSGEFSLLKSLTDFVIKEHFPQIDPSSPERYLMFFEEVVVATAHMVASWQSFGFTHGVCNTDNFSLLSITIDYGPFGFMDAFDPKYVPNTSDDEGRYSYEKQPQVGLFNLDKLKQALSPLWDSSQKLVAEMILKGYNDHFKMKYLSLFTKKLGLRHVIRDQDQTLIELFLRIMYESKSDFTLTFRHLGNLSLKILASKNVTDEYWTIKLIQEHPLFDSFLKMYSTRLEKDGTTEKQRLMLMSQSNPQYVLRNWMAEKAITLAEQNDFSGIKLLHGILKNPFVKQGEAEKHKFANKPPSWASHIRISCSS